MIRKTRRAEEFIAHDPGGPYKNPRNKIHPNQQLYAYMYIHGMINLTELQSLGLFPC